MTTEAPHTPHTPAHRTARSRRTLAGVALLAAVGLTGCTVSEGTDPDQTGTTASPTASGEQSSGTAGASGTASGSGSESGAATESGSGSESATESATGGASPSGTESSSGAPARALSVEELQNALLPAEDFPVAQTVERQVQSAQNQPFTMYLNLNGFEPEGQCAEVFERINTFETAIAHGVAGTYQTDLEPSDGGQTPPSVEVLAVATGEEVDAMSVYSEVPAACGTLQGVQVPEATATFEPVTVAGETGLHAMRLRIDSGSGREQSMVVGGISAGHNHLYTVISLVEDDAADEILIAQAERFQAAVESAESGAGASGSASPSGTSGATPSGTPTGTDV